MGVRVSPSFLRQAGKAHEIRGVSPKALQNRSGGGEGFQGVEGGFPVDVQFLVEQGLLGVGLGRFADAQHAAVLERERGGDQAVGGKQAAQGFPVAGFSGATEGLADPTQEVVGEHADEHVGFDAVLELVEVGAQAQAAFEAGEAFFGLEQDHVERPSFSRAEGALGFEHVVAEQRGGVGMPPKVRRQLPALIEGGFVERAVNVLAFGLPGRGKTHFLAALGRELILRHSRRVLFRPAFKLVGQLLAAKRDLRLESELKKLDRFEVLILDDIGYVQQSREEMEVLFTLLAERYERRSLLISSNLVFSQWDRIFKDPMTTMAAIDRLVHHAIILEFDGTSQRAPKTAAGGAGPPKEG